MSYLRSDSTSIKLWGKFRDDTGENNGIFSNLRESKHNNRGLKRLREKMEAFVEQLNTLFLQKQMKNIPPLAVEKDGSELFEEMLNERVRIQREKEEEQREKAEQAEERTRMRSINDTHQGLVPPVPVVMNVPNESVAAPTDSVATMNSAAATTTETNSTTMMTTTTTNSATAIPAVVATNPTATATQVAADIMAAEATMTRGTLQVTPPTNQVGGTRRGRGEIPEPLQDTRSRQARRTGIDDEGFSLRSCLRQQNIALNEPATAYNGRVPHNERPANRHMDMINRIDCGESITNMVML